MSTHSPQSVRFDPSLYDAILVRYGELALKGRNRPLFEKRLMANIGQALRGCGGVPERSWGRLLVRDCQDVGEATERLRRVFGLVSVSPAVIAPLDFDRILESAIAVVTDAAFQSGVARPVPFKVTARRSEKSFPLDSMELNRDIGSAVMERLGDRLTVNLSEPRIELGVEVRGEGAYVFASRVAGPGGLPVGTVGRVVSLLSGGIDSPVASWLAMKRGCQVIFAHFHSAAFVGPKSLQKVLDLAKELSSWQPHTRLYVFPFAEIQKAIRRDAPESMRTILFRRMMQRVTERLCLDQQGKAIITGESLGQVASQTLTNLRTIARAAEMEVLRPLITFDKEEVIALAEKIGTFEISIRPHQDCCTVFQPREPATKSRVKDLERIERDLDWEPLVEACFEGREAHDF